MKIKRDGKWFKSKNPIRHTQGFRAEKIRLGNEDLAELASMGDTELGCVVRQLSARVNRLRPYQREALDAIKRRAKLDRMTVPTPTRRPPGWPEMQFLGASRSGRWSSSCPEKSQEPRTGMVGMDFSEIERRVAVAFGIPAHMLYPRVVSTRAKSQEPRCVLVDMDFADIERRVATIFGLPTCLVQPRQSGKTDALLRAVSEATRAVVQAAVDEEGCGAAWSAARYAKD